MELFIADSSGQASLALAQRVDEALEEWRCGGIFVATKLSSPQIVDVQLALVFQAGVDTVNLTIEIRSALVIYINSLPAGDTLLRADLQSVLTRYKQDGLIVGQDTIVAPAGDLVPDLGKTLRTRLENVTVV